MNHKSFKIDTGEKVASIHIAEKVCSLCRHSTVPKIDKDEYLKVNAKLKNQIEDFEIQIVPCTCNYITHVICLKTFILSTQKIKCDKCTIYFNIIERKALKDRFLFYFWLIFTVAIEIAIVAIGYLLGRVINYYVQEIKKPFANKGDIDGAIVMIVFNSILLLLLSFLFIKLPCWVWPCIESIRCRYYNFDILTVDNHHKPTDNQLKNITSSVTNSRKNHKLMKIVNLLYQRFETHTTSSSDP